MSDSNLSLSAQRIAEEQGLTRRDAGALYSGELFWRDLQPWLEEQGYVLRPRYNPAWKPSWEGTKILQSSCEDGLHLEYTHIIDATRAIDGAFVALKRLYISNHPDEIQICQYFSSLERRADSENHCVPIFDVLQLPSSDSEAIIVMPMLRKFDDPRFDTVGEAVDFFDQILRGLRYMHSHTVVHGDCNANNVMMDPTDLYPDSYHPAATDMNRSYNGKAECLTRTQKPPKYYFIDYGNARQYKPGTDLTAPQARLGHPGDKTVPEYNGATPYSPFATDVYLLGNLIRVHFLEKKRGFGFMSELVEKMVDKDPKQRPTMDVVVAEFETIRQSLDSSQLSSCIPDRNQFFVSRLASDIIQLGKRLFYGIIRARG